MPRVSNNYCSLNPLQIEAFPPYFSSAKYFRNLIIVSLTELLTLCIHSTLYLKTLIKLQSISILKVSGKNSTESSTICVPPSQAYSPK